jgi:hypothetical protein
LDEREGEMEVSGVGKDEGAGHEEANGEDGAHEFVARHMDVVDAIEEMRRLSENTCAYCL